MVRYRQSNYRKGHNFEERCCGVFRGLGYKHVERQSLSRDGGIDIIMEGTNKRGNWVKIGIECKNLSKNVDRPIVQKLHSAALCDNMDEAWVVTTKGFSRDAWEYAHSINERFNRPRMRLVDGHEFRLMESRASSNRSQSSDTDGIGALFLIIVSYLIWKCLSGV